MKYENEFIVKAKINDIIWNLVIEKIKNYSSEYSESTITNWISILQSEEAFLKKDYFYKNFLIKLGPIFSDSEISSFSKYENISMKIKNFFDKFNSKISCVYLDCTKLKSEQINLSGTIQFENNGLNEKEKIANTNIINNKFIFFFIKKYENRSYLKIFEESQDWLVTLLNSNEFNEYINEFMQSIFGYNKFFIKIEASKQTQGPAFYNLSNVFYYVNFYNESNDPISFEQLSGGVNTLIRIISKIANLDSNSILLLDDPETSMHANMQMIFRGILNDFANDCGCRIVIATHSPFFSNSINLGSDIYIANKNDKKINLTK